MPTLLQRGATWLAGKLQTAGGRTVAYRQGTLAATLTGWVSQMTVEVWQDGNPTIVKAYVWSFETADLTTATIVPKAGDRLTETLNSIEVVYEAMPLADNMPTKDESDTSGLITKVYTKRVRNA